MPSSAERGWRSLLRPRSLKLRTMRDIAVPAALLWLALTLGIVLLVRHEADRLFDDSLRELAQNTLSFSEHELAELRDAGEASVHENLEGPRGAMLLYQVWQPDGTLVFRSAAAPERPIVQGGPGLQNVLRDGTRLRAYSAWNRDHSFQVQMAELPDARQAYVLRTTLLCTGVCGLAMLLFLLVVERRLHKGFALLEAAAAELAQAPSHSVGSGAREAAPAELWPLIDAFNGLSERVQRLLLHEQRFTADAAHELKTPLASLKILLRNAERGASAAEREQALSTMSQVIDSTAALVDQLLALARYDRDPSQLDLDQRLDLAAICEASVGMLAPLAQARRVRLGLTLGTPLPTLRGNREALGSLVRNLLDNAVRHAPEGGQVQLRLHGDADGAACMLEVHDDGPGIPPAQRGLAFARFYRAARRGPGQGLGLAIVERIAQLHGGSVSLHTSTLLGGAMAVVRLPGRRQPPF